MSDSQIDQDSQLEQLLQDAKLELKDERYGEAVNSLNKLLQHKATHREGLYFLAVCLRRQGKFVQATRTLESLIQAHPKFGRAHQELGHLQKEKGSAALATKAYETAVILNPALPASWKALVLYYDAFGDRPKAQSAMKQAQYLAKLPAPLVSVASLMHEDKLYFAERICRQFLKTNAHHPEAMRLLAEIGSKLQILDDAEFLLESCVDFYPDFVRARADYVQVLHQRQKYEKALEQAKELHSVDPNNIGFNITLASEHQAVGNFDKALEIYAGIDTSQANTHVVHSSKGHALKTIGKTELAIESYRKAYQKKPDFGDAYWSLANLKTYQFSAEELAVMHKYEASESTAIKDKVHLNFALGKAYEDQQNYDESFKYYKRGNQLKQQDSQYSPQRLENEFKMQKATLQTDVFEKNRGFGSASTAPIFIVGLPRAGSTLLEQILASHSQVDGTLELANVIGLAHRLGGRQRGTQGAPSYPAVLSELTGEEFTKFGEDFINDTQVHRQGGTYFIDKMPNNFRHIGLIKLMLPNAKIIDARREPMACCFSGFKQLFAQGQEFSYGLDSIGRYYAAYVDLMEHWDNVLPGEVLRVQHEDVLDDLETQVRRILEFCNLPFEQACIDYYKTDRAVRTPSSEQVRQPIFKSAMQHWKNFEPHLQPLTEALGEIKQNYR